IPFTCKVKTKVAQTLHFENKVFENEFPARAIRQATTSPDGKTLIFNAVGKLYVKALPGGQPERLTLGKNLGAIFNHKETFKKYDKEDKFLEYEPSFSTDGKEVVFVIWRDEERGGIIKLNLVSGVLTYLSAEENIVEIPAI